MEKFELKLPGMRIGKTALAVGICMLIAHVVHYSSPFYAAISCVLMMKSTPEHSFTSGKERMQGTLLGGCVAGILVLIRGSFPVLSPSWIDVLFIPAVLYLDLVLCKSLSFPEYAASMSGVLVLVICINHSKTQSDTLTYIISRIVETLIGIAIAVLVNYYIRPRNKGIMKKK